MADLSKSAPRFEAPPFITGEDSDYMAVRADLAATPAEAIEEASRAVTAPLDVDPATVKRTELVPIGEWDDHSEFWVENPADWEGAEAKGEPVAYWRIFEA